MTRIPTRTVADAPEKWQEITNYFNHYAGTQLDIPAAPAIPEH